MRYKYMAKIEKKKTLSTHPNPALNKRTKKKPKIWLMQY